MISIFVIIIKNVSIIVVIISIIVSGLCVFGLRGLCVWFAVCLWFVGRGCGWVCVWYVVCVWFVWFLGVWCV